MTTFPFGHIFANELGNFDIKGHLATNGDVLIGDDVWIGIGSTIMSGITIGCWAVIGAHSHVVKDVSPYEIVGGNPAKRIKDRYNDEIRQLLFELQWWNLPTEKIKLIAKQLSQVPNVELFSDLIKTYLTTS